MLRRSDRTGVTKASAPGIYQRLLEAYREGCSHAEAGRRAGVRDRTAARWFEVGPSPLIAPELGPIKDAIAEDRLSARALIRKMDDDRKLEMARVREDARKQAVEAMAQEGQLARMIRGDAMAVLGAAIALQQHGKKLVEIVQAAIQSGRVSETVRRGKDQVTVERALDHDEAMALLERLGRYGKTGAELADAALKLERLRLGEPIRITETRHEHTMSVKDAVRELAEGQKVLDILRSKGMDVDLIDLDEDIDLAKLIKDTGELPN